MAHVLLTAIRIVTATAVMDQISREGERERSYSGEMRTESRAVGEKEWRGSDAGAKRCDSERNRAAEIQPKDK